MTASINPEMPDDRRSFLSNLLICTAAATIGIVAVAIPALGRAQPVTSPPAIAASPADCAACHAISPEMQTLISEFVHASIRMAATDLSGDAEAIGIIAQDRTRALAALTFHRPETLLELAAKTSALVEFSEDTERFALRMLAEDAARLAGEGAR